MSQKQPQTVCLHGLEAESIVDGIGYRTAIFTQGCPHRCVGCHNPSSHDPAGGTVWTLDDVAQKFEDNPLLDGITLSGGEPFLQAEACAELARCAHAKGLTVWTFSGYVYEKLTDMAVADEAVAALLAECDVLVDGPFVQSEISLELAFCGSRNQRVIDMQKTRQNGVLTLFSSPEW